MESKEKILSGGAMNQVVKIGDTVHRTVKGHPMLHAYLLYLEKAGMPGVPRFLGLDEQGREIYFVYVPELQTSVDYEPSKHAADRRRRIKLFFDAYGMDCPANLMDLVTQRIQGVCDEMEEGAAFGDENYIRAIKEGHLAHYQKIVSHLKAHGQEWV